MELLKQEGKRLDEKATLAAVKRQLYFLRDHFWLLQEEESGMVKEQLELLDFLPYTKSVIQVQAHPRSYQGDQVLQAMQKQEAALAYQKQKQQECMTHLRLLVTAIAALPVNESACIHAKYVKRQTYEQISAELDLSLSSVGRIIRRACLHLAQLLHLECYQ